MAWAEGGSEAPPPLKPPQSISKCFSHQLFSKSAETRASLWGPELQFKPASLPPSHCGESQLSNLEHPEPRRETRVGGVDASFRTRNGFFQHGLKGDSPLRHLLLWVAAECTRTSEPLPGAASARTDLKLLSFSHHTRRPNVILGGWGQRPTERDCLL